MAKEQLNELLNSYQIPCRGVDEKGNRVFSEEQAEPVVVKVYRNGKTEALCRYLTIGCVVPRCNPKLIEGIGTNHELGEDNFSLCPYCSR